MPKFFIFTFWQEVLLCYRFQIINLKNYAMKKFIIFTLVSLLGFSSCNKLNNSYQQIDYGTGKTVENDTVILTDSCKRVYPLTTFKDCLASPGTSWSFVRSGLPIYVYNSEDGLCASHINYDNAVAIRAATKDIDFSISNVIITIVISLVVALIFCVLFFQDAEPALAILLLIAIPVISSIFYAHKEDMAYIAKGTIVSVEDNLVNFGNGCIAAYSTQDLMTHQTVKKGDFVYIYKYDNKFLLSSNQFSPFDLSCGWCYLNFVFRNLVLHYLAIIVFACLYLIYLSKKNG